MRLLLESSKESKTIIVMDTHVTLECHTSSLV
jgi:hypothetical protein